MSGSIPVEERPGRALFAKLERGDIVIAAKLDRLFRSTFSRPCGARFTNLTDQKALK